MPLLQCGLPVTGGSDLIALHAQRALQRLARETGALTIRLDTNRVLHEAIRLYRSAGYREVPRFSDEPYAHHWFEKPL